MQKAIFSFWECCDEMPNIKNIRWEWILRTFREVFCRRTCEKFLQPRAILRIS